jgi:hypothetical protein
LGSPPRSGNQSVSALDAWTGILALVTSQGIVSTGSFATLAGAMSPPTTLAPCFAKCSATARPIPVLRCNRTFRQSTGSHEGRTASEAAQCRCQLWRQSITIQSAFQLIAVVPKERAASSGRCRISPRTGHDCCPSSERHCKPKEPLAATTMIKGPRLCQRLCAKTSRGQI